MTDSLPQKAYDRAFELEKEVGCCPQCVLTAVDEVLGGVDDQVIKSSHGLSGGGGLSGLGACGALSGGLVALGTRRGRDADKLGKGRGMANFKAGRELVKRFENEFGGTTCRDLQKRFTGRDWNLWNPVDYTRFDRKRGDECARATATVARWVVEMLDERRS